MKKFQNFEYDELLAHIQTTQINNDGWEVSTELANYFDEKGNEHQLFNVLLYNDEIGHVEESLMRKSKKEADEAHLNLVRLAPQLIEEFNSK
ncbi:hypothetical protein ACFZL0_000620 [Staphylococcus pseudintermedius]